MQKILFFLIVLFVYGCGSNGNQSLPDIHEPGHYDTGVTDKGTPDISDTKMDVTQDLKALPDDVSEVVTRDMEIPDQGQDAPDYMETQTHKAVCGDGKCDEGETPQTCAVDCGPCGDGVCSKRETMQNCPQDCLPKCGDGVCESGETPKSCPFDCPKCGDGFCGTGETPQNCGKDCRVTCGNGVCEPIFGRENSNNCPEDCLPKCGDHTCQKTENLQNCPVDCARCGDGLCTKPMETVQSCPQDCAGLCGDGLCNGDETPSRCAMDCGACGDGVCGLNEDAENCAVDCPDTCGDGKCKGTEDSNNCPVDCACLPNCKGRECGLDECGFVCGTCGKDQECGDDYQCHCSFLKCGDQCCEKGALCLDGGCCTPSCTGRECGTDGCGGSCGSCETGKHCTSTGRCVCDNVNCKGVCCNQGEVCFKGQCCTPDCEGKDCGDNGCGGSCGHCDFAYECQEGKCVWKVFCGNGKCEPDSGEDCNTCARDCRCKGTEVCLPDGSCCTPDCEGKDCGSDGCGGSCGTCVDNATCGSDGKCTCDFTACGDKCCKDGEICYQGGCCKPSCDGFECGDDGCGGSCGGCDSGLTCEKHLCQCDNMIWHKYISTNSKKHLVYGVAATDDGFYFSGDMDTTLEQHNFWVGKVDQNGILQWTKDFSGSGSFSFDKAFAVVAAGDGGVVAVGKKDTGIWYSGWVVKRDAAGGSVWSKTLGGKGLNQFRDVIRNSAGQYVIVGQIFSGTHYKGWLVALDEQGTSKASKSYNKSGTFDVFRGITQLDDNGYAIAGCYHLEAIEDDDYNDQGKLWLVKLDDKYAFKWHKVFKGLGWSEGYAVAQTSDKGLVVAGYTMKQGGNRKIYVVRTDGTGNKKWSFISPWTKDSVARDVYAADGMVLVTGYGVMPGGSDYDLVVMALDDADGHLLWKRFFGSAHSTDAGYAIVPVPHEAGSYLIGGRYGLKGLLLKISSTCKKQ